MTALSAAESYQLWAETWDATPSPIVSVEHRALLPWLKGLTPRHAVDVGCGTGRWTARLSAVGIDASPAMIGVAAGKGLAGRLAVANASTLPIATGASDLVLCALTFGHIRDQAAAMREFARILAPGGTLILTDFHPEAAARGWRRTFHRNGQTYEIENHPYTVAQLAEMAPALTLTDIAEAAIAEPERELFDRAGRPDLFNAACAAPAVLLTRWVRS